MKTPSLRGTEQSGMHMHHSTNILLQQRTRQRTEGAALQLAIHQKPMLSGLRKALTAVRWWYLPSFFVGCVLQTKA